MAAGGVAETRSMMNMGNGAHKVVREAQENLKMGRGNDSQQQGGLLWT